jgi:hypothetical protein
VSSTSPLLLFGQLLCGSIVPTFADGHHTIFCLFLSKGQLPWHHHAIICFFVFILSFISADFYHDAFQQFDCSDFDSLR